MSLRRTVGWAKVKRSVALIRQSRTGRQRTQHARARVFPGRALHSLEHCHCMCSMYAWVCIKEGMHVFMHAYDVGHCPSIIKELIIKPDLTHTRRNTEGRAYLDSFLFKNRIDRDV